MSTIKNKRQLPSIGKLSKTFDIMKRKREIATCTICDQSYLLFYALQKSSSN